MSEHDPVHHPAHYTTHPSGVECITITEHMNFCLGNAMKYLWRADRKNGLEDLRKAIWYLEREVARRGAAGPNWMASMPAGPNWSDNFTRGYANQNTSASEEPPR